METNFQNGPDGSESCFLEPIPNPAIFTFLLPTILKRNNTDSLFPCHDHFFCLSFSPAYQKTFLILSRKNIKIKLKKKNCKPFNACI